ncbi:MAG: N-terminal acetyltransferase [Claussenomyces sp. TS43310]|nr:MAG: N-terminal acetyltransferase [Claussenomyces sp. TS43310]
MSFPDHFGRIIYTRAQLDAFFDRISLPSEHRPWRDRADENEILAAPNHNRDAATALAFLATLQKYTVAAIPFESLALHYSSRHTISIDPAVVFHKIVQRRCGRGGYCMENSCLFGTVLASLGYDVYPTGARVNEAVQPVANSRDWKGPKFDGWNHMVNIVTIAGQKYFVDVGFGSSGPHHPIPLTAGYTSTIITQPVRLVREQIPDLRTTTAATLYPAFPSSSSTPPSVSSSSLDQHLWIYQYRHPPHGDWLPAYCFGETEFTPSDFAVMNHFTSTSPTSWFTYIVLCVKMIMDEGELVGDVTLVKSEINRRIWGKSVTVAKCENEEQRIEALEEWFGISLTAEEKNGIKGLPSELM